MIDTTGLRGHTMKEGTGLGPAACLAKDGNYELAIARAEIQEAKESKNKILNLAFVVQDDDAKGSVVYERMPVTGVMKTRDGEVPNITRLGNLLDSAGRTDLKVQIAEAGSFDLDKIAAEITKDGNRVYARLVQKTGDDNVTRSEPIFYLKKDKYEDTKKSGANFRVAPRGAPRGDATGGGSTKSNGVPAGTRVVSDALAADV